MTMKIHTGRPTYQQRAARRAALAAADRSNAIEGLRPTEFGKNIGELWVEGRATADECVEMLIRHHTGKASDA